jgi:signal transduction histidine kinase
MLGLPSRRSLLGAGLLTWLVAALGALGHSESGWLAPFGWLVFGLGFTAAAWPGSGAPRAERKPATLTLLLALQSAAAVGLAALGQGAYSGMLLVVVAGELPLMGAPAFGIWIAVQSLLYGLALGRWRSGPEAALEAASWLGFQLFAAGAALFAEREARARADLARVHAELCGTQALLADSARSAERLFISRELHDSLGHHLTALSLQLELLRHGVPDNDAAQRAREIARDMLISVRDVVSTLRIDTTLDLRRALTLLLDGLPGSNVSLALAPELEHIDSQSAHVVFRCVQEALTNSVRHGRAQRIWVTARIEAGMLHVSVRDDGRTPSGRHGAGGGHGLCGIRERLQALGGELETHGEAAGFRLEARLPWRHGT